MTVAPAAPAQTSSIALSPDQQRVFNSLRVLTMFVTNRCNAKCETCFYWQSLNDADRTNLTLDELRQIARTMPKFKGLLVSGGEPVMRKELPEIVKLWREECGIDNFDMPNNGLLTKRVVEVVEQVLTDNPTMTVTVGHSLDGFKETHDRLRGVPNNFEKLFQTLEALIELRSKLEAEAKAGKRPWPRLRLLTLTCINNQNLDEVEELADWVSGNYDIDGMNFECLRGTPKDPNLRPPTSEQFDRIVRKSMEVNEKCTRRRFDHERAERLSYLRGLYRMQRDHITKGKIPATCQAGVNLAVLEPDGRLRFCELLDEVGNLREAGYDWKRVWFGEEAERQRNWIRDCRCSCTHCVNLGNSIDEGGRTRFQRKIDELMYRAG